METPSNSKVTKIGYSYARYSNGKQALGSSIKRQVEMTQGYCRQHNIKLSDLRFDDEAYSGFHGEHLKEDGKLKLFITLCEKGHINSGSYLLCECLDRLGRLDPFTMVNLLNEIIQKGIIIVTTEDEEVYSKDRLRSGDTFQLLKAVLVLSRGYNESMTKSRRNKDDWNRKRQKQYKNGACPHWLEVDEKDRKSTRLNSSHTDISRMPSSA